MANSFYYIDGGATTNTLYIAGTSTDRFVLKRSEFGYGWPKRKHYIEKLPSAYTNLYRRTIYDDRIYGFQARLKSTTAGAIDTLMGTWEDYHNPDLGAGTIKRINHAGATRRLECIPLAPEWQSVRGYNATVRQRYQAAFPWWHDDAESDETSAFNDAANVNVSLVNAGDISTWIRVVITGVVNDPKFTLTDGSYIDVNFTTANADDTLTIDWRPWGDYPKTVYYQEHGSGTITYKTITSGSTWGTQGTGTNNVVAVADSGTCAFTIYWYNYYGSLY